MSNAPFEFQPLPLVRLIDDLPHQICRLTRAKGNAPKGNDTTLLVRRNGAEILLPVATPGSSTSIDLAIPEVAKPCTGIVELRDGDQTTSITVEFAPVRRWEVFLVNHSHTDIGFTHIPSDVERVHTKNLARALEFIDATADWPDEVRYRWTCESAWQVQNYLRTYPHERDRLKRAALDGTLEIEGLYIHSYFDILNREQLVRSLYYAQELRDTLQIPITSAMICDVPGAPWSLVDILAQSDIRYLAMAPNNFLAPFHEITDIPRPFIWQGPAGKRVIVWYTDDPYWAYIEGARHGFWAGIDEVEAKLPVKLASLEANGYPFDKVQIQTGSDNRPLRLLPATIAREWNQRYLSPRMRVTTPSTFFRHAEANWSDQMPVVSGDWQSSWSQTSLHYPKEANQSRRNHATLDLWERTAAFADLINESYIYPQAELSATYDASLLFDEHSGPKGIWRPRNPEQALESISEGFDIFQRATAPARQGLAVALDAATDVLRGGETPAIVVWNVLSWSRSGEVEVELPQAWIEGGVTAVDEETGAEALIWVVGNDGSMATCRMVVTDIPAMGFKRYNLKAGTDSRVASPSPAIAATSDETRIENAALSLTVNAEGTITSLIDRRSGQELVDHSRWPGLNAFVRYIPDPHGPEPGGDFNAATGLYIGTPVDGHENTEGAIVTERPTITTSHTTTSIQTMTTIAGTYQRDVDIRLNGDQIEIRNRLRWLRRSEVGEMLFALFPMALPSPAVHHAGQYGIIDPQTDTLSGSSLDGFAIQNWLDLATDDAGVTIHSADLALVDYGGINLQRFLRTLSITQGVAAFRIAAVRSLPASEGDPFGADGDIEYGFTIRPHAGGFDPLACCRFGEEQALPLQTRPLPAKHPGEWKGTTSSFVSLRSESAVITGLKRAERAGGYVIRLWEAAGRRTLANVSFPHHSLLSATRLTPTEGNLGRMETTNGTISLELAPFELVTVRCVIGR